MTLVVAAIFLTVVFFGASAVLALVWALSNGQFDKMQQGAYSIFSPDEPVGKMTDAFPDERIPAKDQGEDA